MPRKPLVDSPNLPPYGQRSSERRKEQNRLAQRQLRERRLLQDAAQTAELERRQNEIDRLTQLVEELRSENMRLKNQHTNRRRQSVIPISSLSRCLNAGTYRSTPNIFSQGPPPPEPTPTFQYERHSIDFGTLHRATGVPYADGLLSNPVNMGESRSLDERFHSAADTISDGDVHGHPRANSYCSNIPLNMSASRERERTTSSSRPRKRTHPDDNIANDFDFEWPPHKKTKSPFWLSSDSQDASIVPSLLSVPPTTDAFKVSTPIFKPLVMQSSLDLSPKQSSPSSLEPALPIASFLPQSLFGSPRNHSCSVFESYSPQSPSISPVASHQTLKHDSASRNSSIQIRKSSTSGSSDTSVLSAPDLQSKLAYNQHLMPFDPLGLSSQEFLGLKSAGGWGNRVDSESLQSTQQSGGIFKLGSSPLTQPDNSSGCESSSPSVRPGSTLSSMALQMWGEA